VANSPFIRDVPAAQALEAWRAAREAAGCAQRLPAVTVPVAEAAGLVTAAPVWAVRSSPPFDAAGMDGIAVRSADTLGASETTPLWLDRGAFDVVDTGDPMPDGRDAVVMREHVHHDDAGRAELRAAVPPYQHVRSIGEDVSAGELLLPEGHRLRAPDLAAAASAGQAHLAVRKKPVVFIVPTGDEVRPIGARTGPGEILDTNSLMLAEQAREAGCEARCLPIEPDDPDRIAQVVREAAAGCDLLIVIAGSSAGRDDYTARVVASTGTLAVHGVAVRPGHPVVLGVVGRTPVLGAPGYPVSAALTFDIFAVPMLAELSGAAPRERPRTAARLARKLASPLGMDDWVRVRLGSVGGSLVATPLPRGAGVLTSLVRADGLLVVPAGSEGYHAGSSVSVELLRGIGEVERTIVAIGSHDMVLDLASSSLRADDPMVTLASSNVGSLGGLVALRDGLCHIAGSHLLDPDTGEYTLPYVDRVFGAAAADVAVIRLVERSQGLMVASGNPLGISGLPDLTRPGVRYVNRQRGAGTRVLLDAMLGSLGIPSSSVEGYAREEPTHLAVAAAITAGRADAGLGIMAAASAFGLDFVPLATEPYDLVVAPGALRAPQLAPLWTLLRSDRFKSAVEDLGGYSAKEMGRRVRLAQGVRPQSASVDRKTGHQAEAIRPGTGVAEEVPYVHNTFDMTYLPNDFVPLCAGSRPSGQGDHPVPDAHREHNRALRNFSVQDGALDLRADVPVGAAVDRQHVGPADDPRHATVGINDRQSLDVVQVHQPGSPLDRVVRRDRHGRGGHQVGRRRRPRLRQLLVAQEAGDHPRRLLFPAAERFLGQHVGVGDHADHPARLVQHGERADPVLPQRGGHGRERRALLYPDDLGCHHVLDGDAHRTHASFSGSLSAGLAVLSGSALP
jgi:putative molybdopterin biosynthesis protein